MTPAQWRELVAAYLDGRLSADSFKRRFLDAHAEIAARRGRVPAAIQELAYVVEAYAGDPTERGNEVADDDDLRRAAALALRDLPVEEPAPGAAPPPTVEDLEAARARMRGAAVGLGAVGFAGCFIALLWLAIAIMQFFAIAAQVQSVTDFGPAPSTIAAVPLAFIPIVGSVIAFFGARDVWGWDWPVAAVVFLAIPTISLLGGGGFFRARLGSRR